MAWYNLGAAAITAVGGIVASKNGAQGGTLQSAGQPGGGGQAVGGPLNVQVQPPDPQAGAMPSIGDILEGLSSMQMSGTAQPTPVTGPQATPAAAPAPAPEKPKETPPTGTEAKTAGWGEVLQTASKVLSNPQIMQLLMGGAPQTRAQTAAPLAGGQVNPQVMQSFGLNRGGVGQLLANMPRIGGR